jgi:hypothetical protein
MDDYDVVLDALQKHRDKLWEMINRNMSSEYIPLNIMDDIRFYQIEQLDEAIMARKNKTPQREWVGLTDDEIQQSYETSGHYQTLRPQDSFAVYALARAIEAKLKEKNSTTDKNIQTSDKND